MVDLTDIIILDLIEMNIDLTTGMTIMLTKTTNQRARNKKTSNHSILCFIESNN